MPSSKEFFDAWCTACAAQVKQLWDDWDEAALFTNHVLHKPDSILFDVSKKLRLNSYRDYYCVDAILYDQDKDFIPRCPVGQTWIRRVRVAFEHENFFKSGLFQELSHLLIVDCDLRVLVTYPPPSLNPEAEMEYLHEIVSGSDRSEAIAAAQNFLLILGRANPDTPLITWNGYVFSKKRWMALDESKIADSTDRPKN